MKPWCFGPYFQPMPETTETRIMRYAMYEITNPQSYCGEKKQSFTHPSAISTVKRISRIGSSTYTADILTPKISPRCRKELQSPTYPRKTSQTSTRTSTALLQSPRSTAPPAKTTSSGNSITKSPFPLQPSNCSTSKKRFAMSTSPRTVHPRTAFRRSNKRPGTRYRGMKRAAIKVRP